MVSRTQNMVLWMIPVLFLNLGAPPFVQADTAEEPVNAVPGFLDMVEIPAGRFKMGMSFKQVGKILKMCTKVDKNCTLWWFKDEMPHHKVYVNKYWIDIYEVTNQKYLEFVKATGHRPALEIPVKRRRVGRAICGEEKVFLAKSATSR